MKRSESELAALVWAGLNTAADWSNQSLAETRRKAWDYYLNRPRGDELQGRSQVQDTTVRDTYHALMATIMPAYATDHVVQFEPMGPDDADQAEAETCAVNNIFTEDNAGFIELQHAVGSALNFRNGIIKVWLEDEYETVVRRFAAPAGTSRAYVAQQTGLTADQITAEWDGELTTVSYEQQSQRLRVKAIEPSYFVVDPNQQDQDLQRSQFLGERVIFTRGELKDMKVSRAKIDQLPELTDEGLATGVPSPTTELQAKFIEGGSSHYQGPGWADQRTECYWVHMRLDGDRWRFLASNQLILLKDRVSWFPYASGAAWPVPHRWSGLSLYDLLKQTQDAKTSIMRQFMDNLNYCNNNALIYNPSETKQEDVLNRAPGRGIRSSNPTNVGPIPVPDLGSNSLAALNYWDDVSGRQAGAALDMASAEAQSIKDVSGLSVEMQLGPKEQMASFASRNLAETLVRGVFLLIHRTLREEWSGPIMYRKSGDWQETNPGEWMPRNRLNVTIGLSPGDRRRRMGNLEKVLNWQLQLIAGGAANIATSWKGIHNTLADWEKAAELDGAEGYFLDPNGQESQAGQQAAAQESQAQAETQQQMLQMQVQLEQAKAQAEAQKLELDKYKHETELQFKYWAELLQAEIKEAELVEQGIESRASAAAAQLSAGSGAGGTGAG